MCFHLGDAFFEYWIAQQTPERQEGMRASQARTFRREYMIDAHLFRLVA